MRVIRAHHPLFGEVVPLVKIWNHSKKRYYVIELPDKSHTRIPVDWADEGEAPLPEIASNLPCLTVEAIRDLIFLGTTLERRVSKTPTKGLSSAHRRSKEDQHGKAEGPFCNRGKR